MHILYLHQHFALPEGSTGTRSYELARRWVAAGHNVTVLCGRGDICGLPDQSFFEVEGIQVRVVGSRYSQKQGFWRRIGAFIFFMVLCCVQGIRINGIDVIYATSTPLTIGIPAMLLKWFKRVPFIFEVRDQWPQIPIEIGVIKSPLLKAALLFLEKRIYKSASAVVALSPGMEEGVRQVLGITEKPIVMAPNSADASLFTPAVDGTAVRDQMGWQDKFIVMHFGTMGHANGLDFLLEVAGRCQEQSEILFVLIGSGRQKDYLKAMAATRHLKNILFLENIPKAELPKWVAACNVSTVIFAAYPILEHNSANKFFDSLSAGKPILLNYSGWQREKIEADKCGYGCKKGDLNEYFEKLMSLHEDRDQLLAMGKNARRLAEIEFDRDLISNRILTLIEKIHTSKK